MPPVDLMPSMRLGWTANISGHFLFYLPLAFPGFHPFAIVAMLVANLGYQFFLRTELSPRLGPFEWMFNTPAHHRIHHASDAACLDKNFGGTLIVFGRLFGTFAHVPEGKPLTYGLRGVPASHHPVRIVFERHEKLPPSGKNSLFSSARSHAGTQSCASRRNIEVPGEH